MPPRSRTDARHVTSIRRGCNERGSGVSFPHEHLTSFISSSPDKFAQAPQRSKMSALDGVPHALSLSGALTQTRKSGSSAARANGPRSVRRRFRRIATGSHSQAVPSASAAMVSPGVTRRGRRTCYAVGANRALLSADAGTALFCPRAAKRQEQETIDCTKVTNLLRSKNQISSWWMFFAKGEDS